MDWDDVRYLLTVHRAGTMSAAAERLGVNQGTVSRRLKQIEKDFGERLFHRSGKQMVATEVLSEVLPEAEHMQRAFLEMDAQLASLQLGHKRVVRLDAMPWLINHLLLPALPSFLRANPGISVETIASARDRNRASGEADLSLRFELLPKERELCRPLAQITYSVYAPRGHASDELPWIGFGGDSDGYAPARWARKQAMDQVVRVNDAGAMLVAIEQGVGQGLLPDVLGRVSDRIVRINGKGRPELTRLLRILVHPDTARLPHVAPFIDWLFHIIKQRDLSVRP